MCSNNKYELIDRGEKERKRNKERETCDNTGHAKSFVKLSFFI